MFPSMAARLPASIIKRAIYRKYWDRSPFWTRLRASRYSWFQMRDPEVLSRVARLPCGKQEFDRKTNRITWCFGYEFQHAVYDLMQQSWRAMVCTECGRYFVAAKRAQKYCSPTCCGERKRKQVLAYYHQRGKLARQQKTSQAKSQRARVEGFTRRVI